MDFIPAGFFEQSVDLLFALTHEGALAAANPAFAGFVGHDAAALVGKPFASVLVETAASRATLTTALEDARRGQRVWFHVLVRCPDGSEPAIEVSGSPSTPEGLVYCVARRTLSLLGHGEIVRERGSRAEFLQEIVRDLVHSLGVSHGFVSRVHEWPVTRVEMLAGWGRGAPMELFEYDPYRTPCEAVVNGLEVIFSADVAATFSNDHRLRQMGVQSYIGIPVLDDADVVLGHICVLDEKTMDSATRAQRVDLMRKAARFAARELARMRAEGLLALETSASQSLEGTALFDAFTRQIAQALQVEVVFASEFEDPPTHAQMLSLWEGSTHLEWGRYPLDNTPCGYVARGEVCQISERVRGVFPGNPFIESKHLESCVAVPIVDSMGKAIGVLAAMDKRPVVAIEERALKLQMFAARIAAEIERMRAARAAEESNAQFRLLVSTPILEVWKGILALPVIGMVGQDRAAKMMLTLLDAIAAKKVQVAILDLTGVSTVDAETANHLLDIVRAAALLGCDCLVSGIAPSVARTLVELGAASISFQTFATLQSALRHALGMQGVQVSSRA